MLRRSFNEGLKPRRPRRKSRLHSTSGLPRGKFCGMCFARHRWHSRTDAIAATATCPASHAPFHGRPDDYDRAVGAARELFPVIREPWSRIRSSFDRIIQGPVVLSRSTPAETPDGNSIPVAKRKSPTTSMDAAACHRLWSLCGGLQERLRHAFPWRPRCHT